MEVHQVKLRELLKKIYRDHSDEEIEFVWSQLLQIIQRNNAIEISEESPSAELWDSSSAILITYPDAVFNAGDSSLKTLRDLIEKYLDGLCSVIHILPFLRFTSDGGFAVSSYKEIEPRFGEWEDIRNLSKNYILMADLVLNHVSSSHSWVKQFVNNEEPGLSYILNPSMDEDWSNVIRPRSSSLFTSLKTKSGYKQAWTTFGPDQIDLNWHNPNILIEFLNLIILYINSGVRWIRLDAIGFIWKKSGTTCLHLEQVHEIVKILRLQLQGLSSSAVLITETNVPQKENLSYLNLGEEANIAYNFPLPPLLLESLMSNNCDLLNRWLNSWPSLPSKTTFLNFTSSHDGVGLRALEGLMEESRIHQLLINCEKRGGLVSHRRMPNGKEQPYELNISWWSAMSDEGSDPTLFQFERFLLSQTFIMCLKGVPAFYLQAILASKNDLNKFNQSGQRRDLNRERFESNSLFRDLEDSSSNASRNIKYLKSAMSIRGKLKAFHPDSPMLLLSSDRTDLIIICRGLGFESVWAIHNMTSNQVNFCLNDLFKDDTLKANSYLWEDCLNKQTINSVNMILKPYDVCWLRRLN